MIPGSIKEFHSNIYRGARKQDVPHATYHQPHLLLPLRKEGSHGPIAALQGSFSCAVLFLKKKSLLGPAPSQNHLNLYGLSRKQAAPTTKTTTVDHLIQVMVSIRFSFLLHIYSFEISLFLTGLIIINMSLVAALIVY